MSHTAQAHLDSPEKGAADLYRLAFLLTERPEISIDIAVDAASQDGGDSFFDGWMRAWSRRIVISKALAAIRQQLADSARRTQQARMSRWALPPRSWSLPPDTSKPHIEEALLAIDLFPRAAVLLSVYEGVPVADTATLLDADVALVKKAVAIGVRELTAGLAGKKQRPALGFASVLRFAPAAN